MVRTSHRLFLYSPDHNGRLFAFIDRSNIGNAKIDGLTEDLGLTGNRFNIALVVFYVPYSTCFRTFETNHSLIPC